MALWLSALYIRDEHWIIFYIPRFESVPYYVLIFVAFATGWPKRKEIIQCLRQKQNILILWSAVIFLWITAYLWDHGVLHHLISIDYDIIHPFENYLEESTEAAGAFLLLYSILSSILFSKNTAIESHH